MNIQDLITNVLSQTEIQELIKIMSVKDFDLRLLQLKNFFNQVDIFDKISKEFDPMWVVNALHTRPYEFKF